MSNGNGLLPLYTISAVGLIIAYVVSGVYYLLKHFKINKDKNSKDLDYLPIIYFSIFTFLWVGRTFLVLFDISTDFTGATWGSEGFYLWQIGMTLQIIGFGIFFTLMEKRAMKGRDKYILVIIYFTIFIIGMIIGAVLVVVLAFAFSLYIPSAYLYIAIKTDGEVRKKSLSVFFGIVCIFIGSLLISGPIANTIPLENILVHTLSNSIKIIGVFFIFLGFR